MKVLWFANTPCNADEYFDSELKGTGGWLKALDQHLSDKVDLHIAFYHHTDTKPFRYKGATYHPICIGNNTLLKKISKRVFNKVLMKEDVEQYLNIIQHIAPDVVHIHGTENAFSYLIPYTKVPVLVSIQGNITVCHHKYYAGIDRQYASASKSILDRIMGNRPFILGYRKFYKMALREQESMRYCKHIMGRTFWDKYICNILSPEAHYYIGNEILRIPFYNMKWNAHKRKSITLFTTSGNSAYKGFETLSYAFHLLNIDTEFDIVWKVAGITEKSEIVKATKQQLKSHYPTNNLVLMGQLNANELLNELLAADIYIMPSHIENSPNNLCEAMLIGMPCITTYAGGTGSLLNHNKEGLLIQDGDPWVMAGAIKELLNKPEQATKLGINARTKALQRHNTQSVVAEVINVYNKIV